MRRGKPIYYWDANIFLAWLKNERRKPGEMDGLAEVVAVISRQEAIVMTSVMTRAEVLESSLPPHAQNQFGKIFDRPNVVSVDVTAPISNCWFIELKMNDSGFIIGWRSYINRQAC